jgi:hypothetical protein
VERFTKRFNSSFQPWTDYAYDAVALALFLKDRTSDDARTWLKTNSYRGVSGDIRFDANGLRLPEFSIVPLAEAGEFKKEMH